MTPREYLEIVVRPNVAEFRENFADLRRAQNAVASVDALAAHLYHWAIVNNPGAVAGVTDDTGYRELLASHDQDFRLLRDLAKAHKHVRLDRGSPLVTEASQVSARPIGFGQGSYGGGRFGGPSQIVVDLSPGEFAYVETVTDRALAFLEAEMAGFGA